MNSQFSMFTLASKELLSINISDAASTNLISAMTSLKTKVEIVTKKLFYNNENSENNINLNKITTKNGVYLIKQVDNIQISLYISFQTQFIDQYLQLNYLLQTMLITQKFQQILQATPSADIHNVFQPCVEKQLLCLQFTELFLDLSNYQYNSYSQNLCTDQIIAIIKFNQNQLVNFSIQQGVQLQQFLNNQQQTALELNSLNIIGDSCNSKSSIHSIISQKDTQNMVFTSVDYNSTELQQNEQQDLKYIKICIPSLQQNSFLHLHKINDHYVLTANQLEIQKQKLLKQQLKNSEDEENHQQLQFVKQIQQLIQNINKLFKLLNQVYLIDLKKCLLFKSSNNVIIENIDQYILSYQQIHNEGDMMLFEDSILILKYEDSLFCGQYKYKQQVTQDEFEQLSSQLKDMLKQYNGICKQIDVKDILLDW